MRKNKTTVIKIKMTPEDNARLGQKIDQHKKRLGIGKDCSFSDEERLLQSMAEEFLGVPEKKP